MTQNDIVQNNLCDVLRDDGIDFQPHQRRQPGTRGLGRAAVCAALS